MAIGRSQMAQQVTKPPMKRKKNAKGRVLQKVKARYKVFPSAYASGAIAKCRKVGAKNWGKKKPVKKAMGGAIMPSKFRKRPVRRMVNGGEVVANGCGKVMSDRRKVTKKTLMAVRKTKKGAALKRWFKEDWKDVRTGKACGRKKGEKRGTPYCRPSKRVSSKPQNSF